MLIGFLIQQFLFSFSIAAAQQSADFMTRCAAAGVVRCVGFDQASDIAGGYGSNTGIFSGASTPTLDATVKASGNSSLNFTVPAQAAADTSGSYFANFSSDLSIRFGAGEVFFVQWREQFSPEFLSINAGQGWKQAIIGTGDVVGGAFVASCTALEVVTQNTYNRKFSQMYNSCTGSSSHGPYFPFDEPVPPNDFKLQNARPAPFCLYSQAGSGLQFPPMGNCVGYFPNEWMTFQVGITLGPRVNDEFTNSNVKLWIARDGQPSQLAVDYTINLSAGSSAENQKYGKVWLLPYNTNRDGATSYPAGAVWYDELIISKNKIADPGAAIPPTQPPPVNPCLSDPLKITGVKWPTSQTGTRSITWNSGTKKIVEELFLWPGTASFKDDRGCAATVKK